MKQNRFGLYRLPIESFKFCWTECYICGYYYKFEFMWQCEIHYDSYLNICKHCKPTYSEALEVFKERVEQETQLQKFKRELLLYEGVYLRKKSEFLRMHGVEE